MMGLPPGSSVSPYAAPFRSTVVPLGWGLVQAPAEPPLNLHLTVPVPVPASVIVTPRGLRVNIPFSALLASSVKLQGEVEQAAAEPLPQLTPVNSEPALAAAL